MLEVSIIIPSHRPKLIHNTCKKILELNEIDKCEIIVVTDYETSMLENEFPKIHWFNINKLSISAKRNFGISKSNTSTLAFLDDDCLPEKDWLTTGLNYIKMNPDIIGVEGQTLIENSNKVTSKLQRFKRLEKPGFRTNNIFYNKSALEKINFFDERFEFQREDTDLAFSLLEKGYNIGYSNEQRVTHIFRKNGKWDLLKNYVNRRYDPLLHKKHPLNYRKQIKTPITKSALFSLLVYIIVAIISLIYPSLLETIVLLGASILTFSFLLFNRSTLKTNLLQLLIEFISFLIAPFVLWGALLYGSWKFGNLLLF